MKRTVLYLPLLVLLIAPALHSQSAQKRAKANTTTQAPASPVDLNTAGEKDLDALPGVGAATAKKIIAGRPYSSVADLSRAGVSKATIDKIASMVTVSPAAPSPAARRGRAERLPQAQTGGTVDLNTAGEKDLNALPGVGPATARKIIAGRPYNSVADLSRAGVSKATIDKIASMVTVSRAPAPQASFPTSRPTAPAQANPSASWPTPPARSTTTPTPVAPSARTTPAPASSTSQAVNPSGKVWVNLDSRIYHREGSRWYGTTKNGKYMTESEAIAAGYRESKK